MNWDAAPEIAALRDEVRSFVRDNLPADIKAKVEGGLRMECDDYTRWYRILADRGWSTPSWAPEHGGTGWTQAEKMVFEEEILVGGAPRNISAGINMLGPVLIAFGSDEQKRRYLPAIQRTETWWAQGFSEPEAGSDLASLRTRAVLDGDHFVVNGQKTWSSFAHFSDMMFCLVRTDPVAKPQRGISFLLVDLHSPGVEVRPIRTIDGGTDLNEVWFNDVRVPRENLVGELNMGWTYAKYLLGHERAGIAGIGTSKQQLHRARQLAARTVRGGRPLAEHPAFADRLAMLEIEIMALEFTAVRLLGDKKGSGAEASFLKIRGTELRQAIYALLLDIAGPGAIAFNEAAMRLEDRDPARDELKALTSNYLDSRKITIFGGSNEVQRNVIAKLAMGL